MLTPLVLILLGFIVGAGLSLLIRNQRLGCLSLIIVPIGAFAYVGWWQGQHPELLRSTSGLDFVFIRFPPLIGALAGFSLVAFIREYRA